MEYRQMKYIFTVAECGSITKAAELLFISQPALSSFITKTEKDLGVKLFNRTKTPMTLTYAGEKYVKAAERIIKIYERMLKQLGDISGNRAGRLRLGIPWQRLEYMMPKLFTGFREEYPSVDIDIIPGNFSVLEKALLQRQVDFIIFPMLKPISRYQCVEIHRELVYLIAKKGYLGTNCLAEGRDDAVDLRAIVDMPIYVLPHSFSFREVTDGLFEACNAVPSNLIESPSPGSKYRTAAAGNGVGIVLKSNLETTRSDDPLDVFLVGNPPATVGVYAMFLKDAYISKIEQDCIRIIRELFGE